MLLLLAILNSVGLRAFADETGSQLEASVATDCSLVRCFYIRAGASGNGSDWSNAYGQFPSTLVRGATYFVAGGSYGSVTFDDPVSGTQMITIKKATAGDHGTGTGWSNTYESAQAQFSNLVFKTSYYNFDGVTGGGPGSWETGFGFKVKGTFHTIDFPAAVSNISIRHTDIEGGGRSASSDTDLIYLVNKFTNITISYCFLHDTSRTMILTWPANGDGFVIEYSKFARNGTAEHREAWSAGTDKNVVVRYNLFEDIMGTGFIAIVNGNGDATNWDIYGNVFYWTGKYTDGIINTGVIMNRYDGSGGAINVRAVNWHIYNNIIANIRGGSFTAQIAPEGPLDAYVVENNIWYNNVATAGAKGTLVDYNWFFANGSNNKSGAHDLIGTTNPFVDSQPWLTGNWALKAAIPGVALPAPYNKDWLGNTRGADGTFDRGALEYGGASGQATPTPAPIATPIASATPTPSPSPTATPLPSATPARTQNLFTTQKPALMSNNDGVNYELGLRFTATVAGQITGVRFFKSPSETGTHTGKVYSASGALLGSVTFTSETASGWQQAQFASPITITANTEYTVTVNTGNKYYVATVNGLAAQTSNGNLRSVVGNNGVYGPVGAKPTKSYNNTNYFRDLIFIPR
jgi:hypothetical protein